MSHRISRRQKVLYVVSATESPTLNADYGRIRLAGLDPSKRYAVRPAVVGGPSAQPGFRPTFPHAMERRSSRDLRSSM